jgi:hypothetical protein
MTDEDTMKQIAQNYKSGELIVLDAPVPACRLGSVLVQSLFSLISTGIEMIKVHEAKLSMVGKARARPDQVCKVLDTLDTTGGGRSARLDNFRKATVWAGRGHDTIRARGGQDKGQRAELARFVEACLVGAAIPIQFKSLAATTPATIAVRDSLLSATPERV